MPTPKMTKEKQGAYDEALGRIKACLSQGKKGTSLNLSDLGLTSLPPEIGQLSALTELYLNINQLTSLPPEIGELTALTLLYLSDNQLASLPAEIGQLKNLGQLYLHENPALDLPPEVLGADYGQDGTKAKPQEILNYYFDLQTALRQGKTGPLNEAKVLILGQPEAGKSSLVHALTLGCPTPNFAKTDGIVRQEWVVKVKEGKIAAKNAHGAEKLRLNLWDFGGQDIYKATHTFFLTRRAVYVIVTTARKDTSMDSDLEEWLETAKTFGAGAPVWVVINKHDENPTGGPDEAALIRKYHPMLRGFIRTQCQQAKSGPAKGTGAGFGIKEIQETLVATAWGIPEVRQEMSTQALTIKRHLEKMTEPTLTVEDYRKICVKAGETSESLQGTLLDLWDKLGTVRYFPESDDDAPSMKETAILNPEWVTEAVYKVLEDPKLKAAHGLVSETDLDRIMRGLKHRAGTYHLIENVMRRFSQL
jgi:internalin A